MKIKTKGDFSNGQDKIDFMRKLIRNDVPCLVSITKATEGGWQCVPVVSVDDERVKVIWAGKVSGNQVCDYPVKEIISRHDNWFGGKDIASIEKS